MITTPLCPGLCPRRAASFTAALNAKQISGNRLSAAAAMEAANALLEREHSGFRFTGGELTRKIQPEEAAEVERAMARASASGLDGVQKQIRQALVLFGKRVDGYDYAACHPGSGPQTRTIPSLSSASSPAMLRLKHRLWVSKTCAERRHGGIEPPWTNRGDHVSLFSRSALTIALSFLLEATRRVQRAGVALHSKSCSAAACATWAAPVAFLRE